jgi:hypothetical protein
MSAPAIINIASIESLPCWSDRILLMLPAC